MGIFDTPVPTGDSDEEVNSEEGYEGIRWEFGQDGGMTESLEEEGGDEEEDLIFDIKKELGSMEDDSGVEETEDTNLFKFDKFGLDITESDEDDGNFLKDKRRKKRRSMVVMKNPVGVRRKSRERKSLKRSKSEDSTLVEDEKAPTWKEKMGEDSRGVLVCSLLLPSPSPSPSPSFSFSLFHTSLFLPFSLRASLLLPFLPPPSLSTLSFSPYLSL
jgi:hypothetical protein